MVENELTKEDFLRSFLVIPETEFDPILYANGINDFKVMLSFFEVFYGDDAYTKWMEYTHYRFHNFRITHYDLEGNYDSYLMVEETETDEDYSLEF